jgi:hypothetical protein
MIAAVVKQLNSRTGGSSPSSAFIVNLSSFCSSTLKKKQPDNGFYFTSRRRTDELVIQKDHT